MEFILFIIAEFDNLIFKKPGPAISIVLKFFILFSNRLFNSIARFFGFNWFDLPRTREILHD